LQAPGRPVVTVRAGMAGSPRGARRLQVAGCVAVAAACLLPAAPSAGQLSTQLQQVQGKEAPLKSGIAGDNAHIRAFQGQIADLQARLSGLQTSLAIQQALLTKDKTALRRSRARLLRLRIALVRDRAILADQIRASYESPEPDIVTVVMDAHGFTDLLERVDAIKAIGRQNAKVVATVRTTRDAVNAEAQRLTTLTARQQRVTSAVLIERDQVDQIRLDLVNRQAVFIRARSSKSAKLAGLEAQRSALQKRIAAAQARAAAAVGSGLGGPVNVPRTIGSFTPHGGSYGFFQAAGTNYSVGEEPSLAAHLDALGQALHLHLIGISGYRTPQHSVEVGGFANDPHTQGRASDTPGVEGVPESTLNRFGLTRPFGGAAEADHIQLLGG
jgi:peptidoglycan hydrolase CwlO-like protein